ncbi:PerC family transcriptional regulator [Citrobacter braakii]
MRVTDSIAEMLEQNALWRRAATRWLFVFDHSKDDEIRIWIAARRSFCMKKAKESQRKNKYEKFHDVLKAADVVLKKR